ncbi:basic leucine zipper 43-like [Nicotiana tabacum]|uniref:Basic leucine zipper 43-like n=2 Tax=Nicotiana TaxID=4085 RepID=A0A1S3Z7S0_TOBAC|nr:PREDICTED: basic leucine zipper 43-like [Nicotiana sylvestris]XP_016460448.1 PREDICTED: basic leucine zipper 43-like [Nicotiana tabacum]
MIPSEAAAIHYFASENTSPLPLDFNFMHNNLPSLQFSRYLTNLPNYPTSLPVHDFNNMPPSCISGNSTSDEADEQQLRIIDERKKRRMISNRESARRSRMRKQRHLDELWSQVLRLRTENHNLIDKLNQVSDCHERVLQENAELKQEASDLRQMLTHLQINSPFPDLFDLDDVPCNTAHLKAESSNLSITPCTNLLH